MKIEISCVGYSYAGEIARVSIPISSGNWRWVIPPKEAPDTVLVYEDDNQGWGNSYTLYFLKGNKGVGTLHVGEGGNPDGRGALAKIIGGEVCRKWFEADLFPLTAEMLKLPMCGT